jgi:FkbM family methyltransferase
MDEITFREEFGLWWPVSEQGEKLYNYMLNRVTDCDVVAGLTRTRGVVVQAGGFIGMWPARLAQHFVRVLTFEPRITHFKALKKNIEHLPNVRAFNCGLGPYEGEVPFLPKNGGCSTVREGGEGRIKVVTIDSLNLSRCDAIYLDIERYELQALDGAQETIKKFHPLIALEFKEDTQKEYIDYLKKLGYKLVTRVHGDWIFKHGD